MNNGVLLADAFPAAAEVGAHLRRRGLTVAVAESCTGGLLGAVLTSVAGSSAWVAGGVIVYSDAAKTTLLGIAPAVVAQAGAVSEEVVVAMAQGIRARLGTDLGVGITGVAGPGESERKPAGLVYIAVTTAATTAVRRLEGDHGREANRALAVMVALELLADAARGGETRKPR